MRIAQNTLRFMKTKSSEMLSVLGLTWITELWNVNVTESAG